MSRSCMRSMALCALMLLVGCGGIVREDASDAGVDTGRPAADTDVPSPIPDVSRPDVVVPLDTSPIDTGDPGCSPGPSTTSMSSECWADTDVRPTIEKTCGAAGIAVLTFHDICSIYYRYRVYTCCNPDGSGCGAPIKDGGSTSCKSIEIWRGYSAVDCDKEKKVLGKLDFLEPCGPPSHRGYTFACCAR